MTYSRSLSCLNGGGGTKGKVWLPSSVLAAPPHISLQDTGRRVLESALRQEQRKLWGSSEVGQRCCTGLLSSHPSLHPTLPSRGWGPEHRDCLFFISVSSVFGSVLWAHDRCSEDRGGTEYADCRNGAQWGFAPHHPAQTCWTTLVGLPPFCGPGRGHHHNGRGDLMHNISLWALLFLLAAFLWYGSGCQYLTPLVHGNFNVAITGCFGGILEKSRIFSYSFDRVSIRYSVMILTVE